MTANVTNIVFPGQFNPKTDKWCDYKEQLLCALDAAGYDKLNLDKGRSLFLSQCGRDTFALIASLLVPKRPTEVPLVDIFSVLDKFYEPEVNEILQAGKFYKRQQVQGESVQDFVAAISLLSAKCNFMDLKRQLRDRLVLGVRDDRLRRDLLKKKDLTYEVALQMCLDYQVTFPDLYPACVASESKQTPSSVTETEPMDIGNVNSNECRRCARAHRPGDRCPFVKAKCFYCKKFGHIAAACAKKPGRVHQVDDAREVNTSVDTSAEKMMGVYVCVDNYSPPITTDVMIDGVHLSMEVDSGASRTIMSEETYKRLWLTPPPLRATNLRLVTWTQDPLKVLGLADVRVVLGNKEAQCELVVVSGNGPNLLGRNWFHTLGLQVSGLCWAEEEIEQYKKEFPELFKEGLGEYKGPVVSLHVRPDATPRFVKARAVPYPLKEKVIRQLNEMVEAGVLTPVRYSEWGTPVTPVMKEDGTVRMCGDYRVTVNTAIDTDIYPLPTSVEAFVRLSGGRIFSKLDLKNAYTQLKVDDATAMLLTLNTPIGLMKVNRLPFGVSAAPAIFQRLMSTALAGMDGVACLLDDIAVTGARNEEHNRRLREVLSKLQQMGVRPTVYFFTSFWDSLFLFAHCMKKHVTNARQKLLPA